MTNNDKIFIVELTNDTSASATLLNAIFTVKRVRTWRVVPAYGSENLTENPITPNNGIRVVSAYGSENPWVVVEVCWH